MATIVTTYKSIMNDLSKGVFHSVYYLMGEESFFIDSISDYIREHALQEEERDFNQIVLYGMDTSMSEVIQRAQSYPMGSSKQVVIVKEAQHLLKSRSQESASIELLENYLQHIQPTTILVFCHKNGKIDSRRRVYTLLKQKAVVFESTKIKESDMPIYIEEYVKERGLTIDYQSTSMIVDAIGNEIANLFAVMEKLSVSLTDGARAITPELVERQIGISRDYSTFEFLNALIDKNIEKCNKIATYYENNEKSYPLQKILAILFNYYSNLMLAFYSPKKSDQGIAEFLGFRNTWGIKDYTRGMRNYTARQVLEIIGIIREYDAKSKGVGCSANGSTGLLRELIYKILHPETLNELKLAK